MSTEIFWNDAAAPSTPAEHMAAEWLVFIARCVGLTSVTAANASEWLWRFAFVQEMAGQRWGDYRAEVEKLAAVLDRFTSTTLEGRVCDQGRDEFVSEHIAARIECAREQADGAVECYRENAIA